jgi:60 kDa SS-A/Ro ribonucleoprotein
MEGKKMNKNVFSTVGKSVKAADTVNRAGGIAYDTGVENSVAQLIVTGTFNGTFYQSESQFLQTLSELTSKCNSLFLAKAAVYAANEAKMKDTPVFLLSVLYGRGENALVELIFSKVIKSSKMLVNLVQVVRSGVSGRKSFGSHLKRQVQKWLVSRTADKLFTDNIGHANPSLTDVIKLVHPKAVNAEQNNMFRYILDREYDPELLPQKVAEFEKFKKNPVGKVPNVDFRLLSNIKLSKAQWCEVALNMPWNTLRMNLNTLARNGVFSVSGMTEKIAEKLANSNSVEKSMVFPYQLLTTYNCIGSDIPVEVKNAIQEAMEVAVSKVPSFNKKMAIAVDVSGSMSTPVTGYSAASTSTSCRDVAALIASVGLKANKTCDVIAFHTAAFDAKLNSFDSVMTNAKKLASLPSGGTDCASVIKYLQDTKSNAELVLVVSDNMSWADFNRRTSSFTGHASATTMAMLWNSYKKRVKNAKLVLIDIQPYTTTQVDNGKDVLNIGGFSDTVWKRIADFVEGSQKDFKDIVNSVEL